MNPLANLFSDYGDNPFAALLRQLLGGEDQQMPEQMSAIPMQRPDIQAKAQMRPQGPVGGAARPAPMSTDASALDVYQGRASSGRASNGDIIRRMPDGQIHRQSARYGYSEPVQGQGERSGGINRMFPATTGRNSDSCGSRWIWAAPVNNWTATPRRYGTPSTRRSARPRSP